MLLTVLVVPRSSQNKIIPLGDNVFKIKLTAPPVDGKANEALIKVLSEYFKVTKSKIKIVKGEKGRKKTIEISKA